MSHTPLLPSSSKAGRSPRNGENGQARPAPPAPGAPGGRRASVYNVPRENPTGHGAEEEAPLTERSPSPARNGCGRYQAAAVRSARAVTWLAPGGSARKRREKGKPGPSAFPAEGGGVRAVVARLPHCSRESGAVWVYRPGGCLPTRPLGQPPRGGSCCPRPPFRCHGLRHFKHPSRPTSVVPALSSSACVWPGVWDFHRELPEESQGDEPGLGRCHG